MEQNLLKLKKLILNSNPKIGDEGICVLGMSLDFILMQMVLLGVYALDVFVSQAKIESLHLSHCGLTNQCAVASWTYYLNELDLTENMIYNDEFITQLNKSAYVRIDDFKVSSVESKLLEYSGGGFTILTPSYLLCILGRLI